MHNLENIEELDERIQKVLGVFNNAKKNKTHMIYFVMYDIEDNKIRTHIAKFLIRKGCVRVQKSIFLAETSRKVYDEISTTLKEVQEVYDNHDSIFLVPVSTDEIKSMKVIGQSIDFDMIMGNKNTLFF
ncbi:MAG: CRISPR-associated endonuclease Cas2 [Bacteroidetes bacterium 4572_117]|nr:MAG: CRISPR-associated endonuclease Cas2 [Bacteroidetes bacterium 4572_117]